MTVGGGYLSGNMLIPFPFEDGQCLAWTDQSKASDMQRALQRCFVDASIAVDAHFMSLIGWPRIGGFSAGNGVLMFRLYASGYDVLLTVSAGRDRFPVISGKAPWGHYTLVLSSEGIQDLVSASPPFPVLSSSAGREGSSLRLCAKCVTLRPARLESIRVYDGVKPVSEGPHFVLRGDISIKPGNNMMLSEPSDTYGGGSVNGIELNATPGAGLGIVPCRCEETPSGNSSLAGPDGHARLFNDTCYDLEPGIVGVATNDKGESVPSRQLLVHAKCTACCTCQMYESIVNDRLASLADSIRAAKSNLTDYLKMYEDAVALFNGRLDKADLSDVTVSLSGMPIGRNLSPKISGSSVKGRMYRCAFTLIVRNVSLFEVRATINSLSTGGGYIAEATATWSDADGTPRSKSSDSAQGIRGTEFALQQGRSLVVTFIAIKDAMVGSVSTGGFSASVAVGLSYVDKNGVLKSMGMVQRSISV